MRRNYIFFDIGFYEDCNLKCEYCRNHYINNTNTLSLSDLKEEIDLVKRHYKIAVVKISGYGEITTWKDFEKAINLLASEFPAVQVITNGTFTDKTLSLLCNYSNVSLNITVDGHTLEMNSYRTGDNATLHEKILQNLCKAIEYGIPLEINSVLHNKNMKKYESFLNYINNIKRSQKVMVFPFPVKIFERTKEENNTIFIDKRYLYGIVDDWWKYYSSILPNYEYARDLKAFCLDGRKSICHVSWLNIGTGGKDERLICPNYGESLSMGDFRETFNHLEKCEMIEQKNANIQIGDDCSMCFNHYHILNLYIEGRITDEELIRVPSLCQSQSIEIIKKVKEEYYLLCCSTM